MTRKRADVYLVEVGIASSREQAQRLISEGKVFADGKPITKPASLVDDHSHINVVEAASYVSRGGLKLEKALHSFNIPTEGKHAIDIGASTGGFTDCLLRHGTKAVTAIDVGYGQLAWSLRQDPRVTVMERTNIRHVTPENVPYLADIITIDVSFISHEKIFDNVLQLLRPEGEIIALIKPQFEAGRERVGKKGVVRDPDIHKDVLAELWDYYTKHSLVVKGLTYSPVKGPEGNIEFLVYLSGTGEGIPESEKAETISGVVDEAHAALHAAP
ncbi:MAG TPA: TlyA family RNA methyltransferase [Candidatus Aquicultor sp.]|jgi:23S rRNA (cytidine1920-2'-O)/16S rRNA (cytidine1409-2'-O)-methyltransferase